MSEHKLTPLQIQAFARHLLLEEKSAATMEKYLRDIRAFACWLGDREICKELTAEWKAYLAEQGYAPASINAMLSALNSLLAYLDLNKRPPLVRSFAPKAEKNWAAARSGRR